MEQQISVPATWSGVRALLAFLDTAETALSLSADQAYLARLATEEWATNLVKYANASAETPIEMRCSQNAGLLRLEIRDRGPAFDPSTLLDPDLNGDAATRDVGGLGLLLLRELADGLDYRTTPDGWNALIITKSDNAAPADLELLRRVPLLSGLSSEAFAELADTLGRRQLQAGEILFREGDPGDNCYIVLSGELDIITTVSGSELLLEKRRPGHVFGEMALIDNGPRSATLRASSATTLAVLDEHSFTKLMLANPPMALELLRTATARQRRNNQQMIGKIEASYAALQRAYDDLKAAQSEVVRLERIAEELAVARRIQSYFVPRTLPQPPGWAMAAYNRAAAEVGGDFYDCIPLPGNKLGLIVADVAGKGVPAALFVALTRSLVRAASLAPAALIGEVQDAADVLSGAVVLANEYLVREHGETALFVTLSYALLDPETGELLYVNAGHNPPLLVAPTGACVELDAHTGLPLGVLAGEHYTPARTVIEPGGTLIVFTDGITEAMNATHELFDDARLQALAAHAPSQTANALMTTIITAVDSFVGGAPQADDITLLVVQRAEKGN